MRIRPVLGRQRECLTPRARGLFLSAAHASPAHFFVIGGAFTFESVVRYTALVRYSEFGGCPLFGSRKCIAYMGIVDGGPLYGGGSLLGGAVIGGSTVVHYSAKISTNYGLVQTRA